MFQSSFYPQPSKQELCSAWVGKSLPDDPTIPLPAAVLDVSVIKNNCRLMLEATSALKLRFRAHVKTHKTQELTRLQVGEDSTDVRVVVSTVVEAEALVPLLKEYQTRERTKVNVLYGIPLPLSTVPRLAKVGRELGPGTVSVLVDHVAQLVGVTDFHRQAGWPIGVLIKADSGYHRAGLPPGSDPMLELIGAVGRAEEIGELQFRGFYSHNSLSYNGEDPDDAMAMLKREIEVCREAASHMTSKTSRASPLIISVGASPTALSIQNILPSSSSPSSRTEVAQRLRDTLGLAAPDFELEVHAGVYPVFDLQQIAANSRTFVDVRSAYHTQAMTLLAEVISTYPTRTDRPEALISAGTLALAREPCKSYAGWGVVSSWNLDRNRAADGPPYSEENSLDASQRMIVKRVSQEHGIIGWGDEKRTDPLPVRVGDRIRLWINHACIASAGFAWYLIVDSSRAESGDVVQDVWVRCRGW